MDSYFVGSKSSPEFLVELRKKTKDITIYKPDKISKDEEFYEKYALGKIVFTAKNAEIIFTQNTVSYKKEKYTPELIIRTNNKYILVNKNIKKLKTGGKRTSPRNPPSV
jgi:hypothetical protein